jgi:hypothetical protein
MPLQEKLSSTGPGNLQLHTHIRTLKQKIKGLKMYEQRNHSGVLAPFCLINKSDTFLESV